MVINVINVLRWKKLDQKLKEEHYIVFGTFG